MENVYKQVTTGIGDWLKKWRQIERTKNSQYMYIRKLRENA